MSSEKRLTKRRIGLCSVDMVKVRINGNKILNADKLIRSKYNPLLEKYWFESNKAIPFEWLQVILRIGLKDEDMPHYFKISKADKELPLAIEMDAYKLREADEEGAKVLAAHFEKATLKALIHAGRKYELPVAELECELKKLETVRISFGYPNNLEHGEIHRTRDIIAAQYIDDEITPTIENEWYSTGSPPFNLVLLKFKYDEGDKEKPIYSGIDKVHNYLKVSLHIDKRALQESALQGEWATVLFFVERIKNAIQHIGKKYDLPTKRISEKLDNLENPFSD